MVSPSYSQIVKQTTPLWSTFPPLLLSLSETVRLNNGTGRCSGRVEVYQNAQWGKICQGHFGLEEAGVVCKELNCGAPKDFQDSLTYGDTALRGHTSRCVGNVSSISQCALHEITGMCQGVSLTCAGKSEKIFDILLSRFLSLNHTTIPALIFYTVLPNAHYTLQINMLAYIIIYSGKEMKHFLAYNIIYLTASTKCCCIFICSVVHRWKHAVHNYNIYLRYNFVCRP